MATLNGFSLEALAAKHGFNQWEAKTMAGIALAESGGNTDVIGPLPTHKNTDGTSDYGLWQINSSHTNLITPGTLASGAWKDPDHNAAMAHNVYAAQGFKAWSSWNADGSGPANKKIAPGGVSKSGSGPPDGAITTATNTALDIPGAIKAAADSVTAQAGKMGGQAVAVVVAVALLGLGVAILLGKPGLAVAAVTTPAGKVAKLASTAAGTGGAHR